MCKDEPGVGNYTCLCKSGYTGEGCDVTVDPCESNPCKNLATCESHEQVPKRDNLLTLEYNFFGDNESEQRYIRYTLSFFSPFACMK